MKGERELDDVDLVSWRSLIARIEIGGAIRVRLSLTSETNHHIGGPYGRHHLVAMAKVPERKRGYPVDVMTSAPLRPIPDQQGKLSFIRSVVHRLYIHEADEHFVLREREPVPPSFVKDEGNPLPQGDIDYRSVRPFDPHRHEMFYPVFPPAPSMKEAIAGLSDRQARELVDELVVPLNPSKWFEYDSDWKKTK